MDKNLEYIKEVIAEGSDNDKLELAEELLNENSPAQAQNVLDSVNERDAKWHFLQSKVFYSKGWIYESKNQMEIALELEPNNGEYIKVLEKLNALGETEPKSGKSEMRDLGKRSWKDDCAEGCAEGCCEGCCYCICTGICEGIGNGC